MTDYRRKLLTVITEAALEGTLIQAVEHLGARGYTIVDARGKGARGVRDAGWGLFADVVGVARRAGEVGSAVE